MWVPECSTRLCLQHQEAGTGDPPTKDALNTPGHRRTAAICETHTCINCVRHTNVHEVMLNENKEPRLSDLPYMCLFM